MESLYDESGITVKQLKEWVKDLPEVDEDDEEYEVFVTEEDGIQDITSVTKRLGISIGGDVLISSRKIDTESVKADNSYSAKINEYLIKRMTNLLKSMKRVE